MDRRDAPAALAFARLRPRRGLGIFSAPGLDNPNDGAGCPSIASCRLGSHRILLCLFPIW
jgi:hypothetical protein